MTLRLFLFVLLCWPITLWAQEQNKRMLSAHFSTTAPKLDGELSEACWAEAPVTGDFILNSPRPGDPMEEKTEVRVVYTNEAIYVAFVNFDSHPDSIANQLVGRDNTGNRDYCGITFCCYRDGINGFGFYSSPAGEQRDVRIGGDEYDESWNAVWACETKITDRGWTAEFKIPYAALRFPQKEEQLWDVNFEREVRRKRHVGHWNKVDPNAVNELAQMGSLTGIKGIEPPKRIFFFPYLSSYYDIAQNQDAPSTKGFSYRGGMDMKIGLNDAFTLDATLIPDFGQTISDQKILNLTPFEIQFQDNRQFFIEGTEIFNKAGLFYSRRVGDIPVNYDAPYNQLNEGETVVDNPGQTQLLNAIKVSGRNKGGLGIGIFNAITGRSYATIEDSLGNQRSVETSPLSNYSVVVLDQNLKNNSYFNITNTNVTRAGSVYDANVTGFNTSLRNKKNTYAFGGSGVLNKKIGPDQTGKNASGYAGSVSYGKISGNFRWNAGAYVNSDTYDPNDLAFLAVNNNKGVYAELMYNIYKPFGKFNNFWSSISSFYENLYAPNHFSNMEINGEAGVTDKKFHSYGISFESAPVRGFDFFEPRVDGRYFTRFRYAGGGGWISTDYRRRFALDLGSWSYKYENEGRVQFNWRISPRFRVNDHLMLIYVYSHQNHFNDLGWAARNGSEPVFGKRDVISHTNVLTLSYAFNPWMSANCRVRHYWGYSTYRQFYSLNPDGTLGATDFNGFTQADNKEGSDVDRNFNSFTIDLFYRWIFTPGSELVVGWKNEITAFDNNVAPSLREDWEYTFQLPQRNTFSLRVIYFLDYRIFTRHKGDAILRNANF
jgi:hypothetical protein